MRGRELSIYGSSATAFVSSYHYDIVFLGLSGITDQGLFDYSPEDSEIKRAFIQRSDQVIALGDASKFNRQAMVHIAELKEIHILIVDVAPPETLRAAIEQAGLTRQALHAAVLGFIHPVTGQALRFETEPPEDMATLERLLSDL